MSKDGITVPNMPSLEKIIDVCWPLRELAEEERGLVERCKREIERAATGIPEVCSIDAHSLSVSQCLRLKRLLMQSVLVGVQRLGVALSNVALDGLRKERHGGPGAEPYSEMWKDIQERDRLARLVLQDPEVWLPLELASASWVCDQELTALARNFHSAVRRAVATRNTGIPRSALEILATDSDPEIRGIVASRFPLEIYGTLRGLIRDPDLLVRRAAAKSPRLQDDDFEFLLQERDTEILLSLAENPAIRDKHLFSLAIRQAQEGSWGALVQKKAASVMRSRLEARESSSIPPPEQQGGEEAPS